MRSWFVDWKIGVSQVGYVIVQILYIRILIVLLCWEFGFWIWSWGTGCAIEDVVMCWIDLKVELEGRMKIEDYFVIHWFCRLFVLYNILYWRFYMFRSNPHLSLLAELQKCGPLPRSESLRRIGTGFYTLDSTADRDRAGNFPWIMSSRIRWELWITLVSIA